MTPDRLKLADDVADWMIRHSYATVHGDTMDDLLGELVHQVHANAMLEAHRASAQRPTEWLPVALYPDDNSIVLVANPDEGRLPVIAWKVEDKWFKYDLTEREPLDPQPTIWTEWPKIPKAAVALSSIHSNTEAE